MFAGKPGRPWPDSHGSSQAKEKMEHRSVKLARIDFLELVDRGTLPKIEEKFNLDDQKLNCDALNLALLHFYTAKKNDNIENIDI